MATVLNPEKLGVSPGRTYSSWSTHVPRLTLAWNVTVVLPAPKLAVPKTENRAGAPGAASSRSSSIFAADSPAGVAAPDSVNPPLRVLTEFSRTLEAGLGPIVTLTVRELAATTPCFGSWNFALTSHAPAPSAAEIAKLTWLVASRSVAAFLNAPFALTARANTVTVPLTWPLPGATLPSTSALPPCD